jgi:hypothetical protein
MTNKHGTPPFIAKSTGARVVAASWISANCGMVSLLQRYQQDRLSASEQMQMNAGHGVPLALCPFATR